MRGRGPTLPTNNDTTALYTEGNGPTQPIWNTFNSHGVTLLCQTEQKRTEQHKLLLKYIKNMASFNLQAGLEAPQRNLWCFVTVELPLQLLNFCILNQCQKWTTVKVIWRGTVKDTLQRAMLSDEVIKPFHIKACVNKFRRGGAN